MSENVTTVNLLPSAGTLSGTDLLYLIQGSGADRDRKLALSVLKAYMSTYDEIRSKKYIAVIDDDTKTVSIDNDSIIFNYELSTQGGTESYVIKMNSTTGVELKRNGTLETEIGYGYIKIDNGTLSYDSTAGIFSSNSGIKVQSNTSNFYAKINCDDTNGGSVTVSKQGNITNLTPGKLISNGDLVISSNIHGKTEFTGDVEFDGKAKLSKAVFGKVYKASTSETTLTATLEENEICYVFIPNTVQSVTVNLSGTTSFVIINNSSTGANMAVSLIRINSLLLRVDRDVN